MRLSHLVNLMLKLFLTRPQGTQHAREFLPSRQAWRSRAPWQAGEARLSTTTLSESQSLRVINGPGGAAVSAPWCGPAQRTPARWTLPPESSLPGDPQDSPAAQPSPVSLLTMTLGAPGLESQVAGYLRWPRVFLAPVL